MNQVRYNLILHIPFYLITVLQRKPSLTFSKFKFLFLKLSEIKIIFDHQIHKMIIHI